MGSQRTGFEMIAFILLMALAVMLMMAGPVSQS
jgi:hypothetical protein